MPTPFAPHAHSQALLHGLCRQLAALLGEADPGAAARASCTAAFRGSLRLHRDDLLRDVFPALREAMAGSDAVCIRAMQADAAGRMDALEAAWRTACDARSPEALQALARACDGLLALENAEVLPMADRLLDAAASAQVLQAMQGRRSAP